MLKLWVRCIVAAVVAFGLSPVPVKSETLSTKGHASERTLNLEVGMAVGLTFDGPIRTVVVGDPAIATARLVGEKTVVVLPVKIGVTNLLVLNEQAEIVGNYSLPVAPPTTVSLWQWGDPLRVWCSDDRCVTSNAYAEKNYKKEVVSEKSPSVTTNITQQGISQGQGGEAK